MQPEAKQLCCPDRHGDWALDIVRWRRGKKLKAVIFIDEDTHDFTDKSKLKVDQGIVILPFPKSLNGCSDLIVFGTVIKFIEENFLNSKSFLIRKVKFYFVSADKKFIRHSRAEEKLELVNFGVKFLPFNKKRNHTRASEEIIVTINKEVAG